MSRTAQGLATLHVLPKSQSRESRHWHLWQDTELHPVFIGQQQRGELLVPYCSDSCLAVCHWTWNYRLLCKEKASPCIADSSPAVIIDPLAKAIPAKANADATSRFQGIIDQNSRRGEQAEDQKPAVYQGRQWVCAQAWAQPGEEAVQGADCIELTFVIVHDRSDEKPRFWLVNVGHLKQ